jgi:hypothetical protein
MGTQGKSRRVWGSNSPPRRVFERCPKQQSWEKFYSENIWLSRQQRSTVKIITKCNKIIGFKSEEFNQIKHSLKVQKQQLWSTKHGGNYPTEQQTAKLALTI